MRPARVHPTWLYSWLLLPGEMCLVSTLGYVKNKIKNTVEKYVASLTLEISVTVLAVLSSLVH